MEREFTNDEISEGKMQDEGGLVEVAKLNEWNPKHKGSELEEVTRKDGKVKTKFFLIVAFSFIVLNLVLHGGYRR